MSVSERIEIRTETLLPKQGVVNVRIAKPTGIVNPADSKMDADAKVRQINTVPFLNTFFDPQSDKQRVLDLKTFHSGRIATIEPTGGYAELSQMKIGASADSLTLVDQHGTVKAHTEHDLPPDLHTAYLADSLATLLAFEELAPQGNKNFAATNCVKEITSSETRTSRSVALPHTHIVSVSEESIVARNIHIPHIKAEKKLLETILPPLVEQGAAHIPFELQDKVVLAQRDVAPYGYSLLFPSVTRENALQEVSTVQQAMAANHEIYQKVADGELKRTEEKRPQAVSRIKPQPSYCWYMHFTKENTLEVIISPQVISHAGVMERAGAPLNRDVSHPQLISEEEKVLFHRGVVTHANNLLLETKKPSHFLAAD